MFEFEPKIVMAGILIPGRDVEISLTSNFSTNNQPDLIPIENATVTLYEDDTLIGVLDYFTDGVYKLQTEIFKGKTYTLRVSCNNYPSAEATTTVPTAQSIDAERSVKLFEYPDYNQQAYDTFVRIDLPAQEESSYYAFCFYEESVVNDGYETYLAYEVVGCSSPDKFVEYLDNSYAYKFSRDKLADFTGIGINMDLITHFPDDWESSTGSNHTIFISNEQFAGQGYILNQYIGRLPTNDKVNHVNIYQLSEDLYKSFKGIAAQKSTQNSLFVTPVPTYNSVKGGLGYFGAALVQTIKLDE